MVKGQGYAFAGEIERGSRMVGIYNGKDEETGFLIFTDVAPISSLTASTDNVYSVMRVLKVDREEAEKIMNEVEKSGIIPYYFISHNLVYYSCSKISTIYPINYKGVVRE